MTPQRPYYKPGKNIPFSTSRSEEEDAFYQENDSPMTTFKCKDRDLKVQRAMLLKKSPMFSKIESAVDTPDYDVEIVKFFLDVFMDFKKISLQNITEIFPIAYGFGLENTMQQCVDYSKSYIKNVNHFQMMETMVRLLNMATKYDCEDLMDVIISFFVKYGIENLFSNPKYCELLEPKAVVLWGKSYLKKNNLNCDLRTFFSKNFILGKLSLDCLNSVKLVLSFHDRDPKYKVFTDEDVLNYLREIVAN